MAWACGYVDDCSLTSTITPHIHHPLIGRVFQAFHFVPGPESSIVVPGNELAYTLVEKAHGWITKGIAFHALQDTFTHQGWSGLWEPCNDTAPGDMASAIAPAMGHAKVGRVPDHLLVDWRWTDPRNGETYDNRGRATEAAKATWEFLSMAPFPDGITATFDGDYDGFDYHSVKDDMARLHAAEFERAALRHLGNFLETL